MSERDFGPPRVSVVVPTRDRAARLAALLRSLAAQTAPPGSFEVIVVDDGSIDATAELLEREGRHPRFPLRTVANARAAGPATARNRGWRAARAPLVAFVDDDCEATPGWLEVALGEAAAHPGAVIQGATLPAPAERHRLGPFARTREIRPPTPWFETCNIFYPRDQLERLDGFDERFGDALGEDTDLGWRALEAGASLRPAPDALVHHAVEVVGGRGVVRDALRGADAVYAFRRHPRLRRERAFGRFFWRRSHALGALALVGLGASRRRPTAALLCAPYVVDLARRCRARGGGPSFLGWLAVCDALEVATATRGSIRHRIVLL